MFSRLRALSHCVSPILFGCLRSASLFACLLSASLFASALSASSASADDTGRTRLRAALRALPESSVSRGARLSVEYGIDVSGRIERGFPAQSVLWEERAARYLASLQSGVDPFQSASAGTIFSRAYRSRISQSNQGYTVYLPRGFDPARTYPMLVTLHGGSSNGNLFLGVCLGNNMTWTDYPQHLWDQFEPKWHPDGWIVVAPDGYGQVMWRWMGEQDVLDVIDDMNRNYRIDRDRIVLSGVSNGGMGTYNIGMRHAWRFAAVYALAASPSWMQYTDQFSLPLERQLMEPLSGLSLIENAAQTDLHYFHGRRDGGPMRPAYVEELDRVVAAKNVRATGQWFDAGHDLLYLVHRQGRLYRELDPKRRQQSPAQVSLTTGDYRAARQSWVEVTRFAQYPALAHVDASLTGDRIELRTTHATGIRLHFDELATLGARVAIAIDGTEVFSGERNLLGNEANFTKSSGAWRAGFPAASTAANLSKQPGLSGPITDAYFDRIVHVYGTTRPESVAVLRRTAERAARGHPLWLWSVQQQVIPDTQLTPEIAASATVALYGAPGENAVLDRIAGRLPIRASSTGFTIGNIVISDDSVGARFIYPNPEAPDRYVIVSTGTTTNAVALTNNLPDFLADYVVFKTRSFGQRARLVAPRNAYHATGFFDSHWRIPQPGSDDIAVADAGVPRALDAGLRPTVDAGVDARSALARLRQPAVSPQRDAGAGLRDANFRDVRLTSAQRNALTSASIGILPVPEIPANLFVRTVVDLPRSDPAYRPYVELMRRSQRFENFRAEIPGATWMLSESAWSVRPMRECLRVLRELGVPFRQVQEPLETPVPVPVAITGPVHGVVFRYTQPGDLVVSCELATRLPVLADAVHAVGVVQVNVMSAYRSYPETSFHTFGMALDLPAFRMADRRTLRVERMFEISPNFETCATPPPANDDASTLLRIACALYQTGAFSSVLTPNYNAGHRDHFHVDIRPDDARLFLR